MALLSFTSRIYRLSGLTPIMGSLPGVKEIRAKATGYHADTGAETDYEVDERGLTIFARDVQNRICVMSYQLKGFFKSALNALKGQYSITAYKSKVDLLVFPEPRFIPLMRDGKAIMTEDDIVERPLRSSGLKGDRMAIASSEKIDDPWYLDIEITLIPLGKTARQKGDMLTWDVLETALEYGAFHGLGQWRNAGYGRFTWQRLEK